MGPICHIRPMRPISLIRLVQRRGLEQLPRSGNSTGDSGVHGTVGTLKVGGFTGEKDRVFDWFGKRLCRSQSADFRIAVCAP